MRTPFIFLALLLLLSASACTESGVPDNPFDDLPRDTTTVDPLPDLDPNSIAGIHEYIFKPTCANSGCHDGTFEPDFRTIESSYNTLVYHPVIKNNPAGEYTYRVMPGSADQSVLWNRLNVDIDGQSGIMPLALEPTSDWEERKSEYLNRIRAWIDGGAKDMFGNKPSGLDLQPAALGLQAYIPGNANPIPHENGGGAIQVPGGTPEIEIWVALNDDNTPVYDLGQPEMVFSENMNDFAGAQVKTLAVTPPRMEKGYLGTDVAYQHKLTLSLAGYPPNTNLFVRVRVTDPAQPERTELPSNGSNTYIKRYFSLVLK